MSVLIKLVYAKNKLPYPILYYLCIFHSQRAMKTQDHRLAMQLMRLRADIQQIKLQKTSSEHRDLIDNSAYSVEEESELMKSGIFDLSLIMPTMNNNNYECMSIVDKPLKDMGVTRMNLNRRRFSLR